MNAKLIFISLVASGLVMVLIGFYRLANNSAPQTNRSNTVSQPTVSAGNSMPTQPPTSIKTAKPITVPSRIMWHDTGINVSKNATVKINYRGGQWTNVVGSNFVDGQGKMYEHRNLLIVPSSHLSALVAKVGEYKFHVGNSYNGKPGSGKLYLSLNDIPNKYSDNDGELDVFVEVE